MNCKLAKNIRMRFSRLRSNHLLPGASNWWNPCGVVNGFYTNLAPDDGDIMQPGVPGARAGMYQDTGVANVSVELVWRGFDRYQAGPMVCINPDASDFGIGFWYEKLIYGGTAVLWALGRQPSNIRMIAQKNDSGYHASGSHMTLRMDVIGDVVKCYRDGVLMMTETVPAELVGSTIHGLSVDVNKADPRLPRQPCAVAPYKVRAI